MKLVDTMRSRWAALPLAGRAAVAVILGAWMLSLCVALLGEHGPMTGDEVVHYYLVVSQAGTLPTPTVDLTIPMEGWSYTRSYPHVFLWHYVGAIIWRFCCSSFGAVQVYQSLFWLQLLVATWWLGRGEGGRHEWRGFVALCMVASLPMAQLFAVLLYQDVPAAAQLTTAFLLLSRRRMGASLVFMGLALAVKVTSFTILPVYLLAPFVFYHGHERARRTMVRIPVMIVVTAVLCWPMAAAMKRMQWNYYPVQQMQMYFQKAQSLIERRASAVPTKASSSPQASAPAPAAVPASAPVITRPEFANHPGDLRIPINWLIYIGPCFWALALLSLAGGCVALCMRGRRAVPEEEGRSCGSGSGASLSWWALGVALWIGGLTGYHLRTAPDARFFLPLFPFLAVFLAGLLEALPLRKLWLGVMLLAMLGQVGGVAWKTVQLRRIDPGIKAVIAFMKETKGELGNFFMYPEGHERFIPNSVAWDLDYALREFWAGDNDLRIAMLRERNVGVIIVKKARIKDVAPDTVDLGAYPRAFVNDLERDPRFVKLLENDAAVIYRVPSR